MQVDFNVGSRLSICQSCARLMCVGLLSLLFLMLLHVTFARASWDSGNCKQPKTEREEQEGNGGHCYDLDKWSMNEKTPEESIGGAVLHEVTYSMDVPEFEEGRYGTSISDKCRIGKFCVVARSDRYEGTVCELRCAEWSRAHTR